MDDRRCRYCQQTFRPAPYHPQQRVCSKPACQRRRRNDYRRQKIASDPVYQQVCLESPRKWRTSNPDYWKEYRQGHPEQVERNRRQQRVRDLKRRLVNLANNNLAAWQVLIFQSADAPEQAPSGFLQTTSLWCRCFCCHINPLMPSEFFNSRTRIRALRHGPAGPLFENFSQALSEAGYETITAHRHLRAAKHFIHWAHRHGTPVCELNEQSLEGFNRHLSRCRCSDYRDSNQPRVGHGARLFLTYLRDARINALHAKPPVHDPALLSAFCQWMRQQRGSTDLTLHQYSIYIREALGRLGEMPSCFDARRLRVFALERTRSWGPTVAQKCTTALRMFLRFLIAEGKCAVGLDAAIPTPAHWRLASLPRYLQPEEVELLIASCDQASAVGWRDRAILILLARLGLRAGDIVHLRLSDIDWEGAWVHVCGKGRRHTRLPLTQEVGDAIVTYLNKGRPRTNTDTLFIRCRAPFCAFSSSTVSHIVDKALRCAGVKRPSRGAAHLLRHSLATSMLRQGASLEDIAPVLRHRSIETTQIYAKVDITALRQIAQPWPEA